MGRSKLKHYSPRETARIINVFSNPNVTAEDKMNLQKELGRPVSCLEQKFRFEVKKGNVNNFNRRYSKKELKAIEKTFTTEPKRVKELAKILGRTESALQFQWNKIKQMKKKKEKETVKIVSQPQQKVAVLQFQNGLSLTVPGNRIKIAGVEIEWGIG